MKLKVLARTSEDTVWEGEADAVSSTNIYGRFDILPEHAQMVTLIENNPIIVHSEKGEKKIDFKKALLHVHENLVSIYITD